MTDSPKGRMRAGVIASAIQVVASGVVLFVLYRYLYRQLGVEQIGIWSLILATTSVSRIGELGLSAGVVRFVAQARGRNDGAGAAEVVQTAAVTLALFVAIALALLWSPVSTLLPRVVPAQAAGLALGILPIALCSLWLSIVGSVFCGALDGCLRVDRRCLIMASSHVVLLVGVLLLVPRYGLHGLALSQLIQALVLTLMAWFALKRELKELPIVPHCWSRTRFREMIGYGTGFQVITVMNLLFDPLVKVILGKFGGLGSLGHYEMANKLILQGRAVIVEAGRVIVPSVAFAQGGGSIDSARLYSGAYRLTYFTSVFLYGSLGIGLYGICLVWIGKFEPQFMAFALILVAGWFANTLIGPAYFSNLGSGHLRDNIVSHVIMGSIAPTAGVVLGATYEGIGVVSGAVLGLVSGSMYLLARYLSRTVGISPGTVVPKGLVLLTLLSLAAVAVSNALAFAGTATMTVIGCGFLSAALLAAVAWVNPMRKELIARFVR